MDTALKIFLTCWVVVFCIEIVSCLLGVLTKKKVFQTICAYGIWACFILIGAGLLLFMVYLVSMIWGKL